MEDKNISHGLWAATATGKPELASLQGEHKTEVAIIGGGYTGLSAALHLSLAGTSSILLEANDVGFGGAGRNVGLVNAGLWLMPEDVIKLVGTAHGPTLIDVLGASPDLVYGIIEKYKIPCEPWRHGTLHCADSMTGYKALQQREKQWQERGADVRLLEKDEAAQKIGSKAYFGALLDKRAGTVQPLAYAYGLAGAALSEGATLYNQSPVISLVKEWGFWRLKTHQGSVLAKSVILAVQGYPEAAFADQINTLVPFNYFQFATKPLPPAILETVLPGKNGAWDTNLILSSYRLDAMGRLIIGSVGNVENVAWSLNKAWAKRSIQKVFPQIGKVDFEHGWYGRIAMTPNHIPRFHVLGDNLAMVSGYNGRGIGPGTVFGKLLATYMMGGSPDTIPLPVSEIKPVFMRSLQGLFYEAGSRMYHLVQRRI
ncbi:MAG: FAD-binding oxidoreductase [Proteobacteria bacterium]|nr:FAD-binding oxidoreductase [Desulfobacula sp.]MBU3953610.1 FAD-binding oxidoreductase [Pseudomonadota bacterium]MBU4132498.1 FAD-binding oxidoreductase [Pseudomonadota bacterium]